MAPEGHLPRHAVQMAGRLVASRLYKGAQVRDSAATIAAAGALAEARYFGEGLSDELRFSEDMAPLADLDEDSIDLAQRRATYLLDNLWGDVLATAAALTRDGVGLD